MNDTTKTTTIEQRIGRRIWDLRGSESQSELAEAVGVSREIVQHWERGSRHIKADNIVALARHFGVTTDYLLCMTNERAATPEEQAIVDYTGLTESSVKALHNLNESSSIEREFRQTVINRLLSAKGFQKYVLGSLSAAYSLKVGATVDLEDYLNTFNFSEDDKSKIRTAFEVLPLMNLAGYTKQTLLSGDDAVRLQINNAVEAIKKMFEKIISDSVNGGADNGVHKTKD